MDGRSRFVSEDEADEALQTSFVNRRSGKFKFIIYGACGGVGTLLAFTVPLMMGAGSKNFHYPFWPFLVILLTFLLIALVIGLVLNHRIVATAYDDFDRKNIIKRFTQRSLVIMIAGILFTILFLSLMFPATSWLEDIMEKDYGTHEEIVSGWSSTDFRFTPNDPFDITRGAVHVEVDGNYTVDMFIGTLDDFKKIDVENLSQVQGKSLPRAYSINTTTFDYDGKGFEPGIEYALRIYNNNSIEDVSVRIIIHRDVDDSLITAMMTLCLGFAAVGGLSMGLMMAAKKRRPVARVPASTQPRERARDAAHMFSDMEEQVDSMFASEGRGFRDGRVPPGPARERPTARSREDRMAVKEAALARGRARRGGVPQRERPRAPARGPVTNLEPRIERPAGVKRTISCPRCKTRFSYEKVEGRVIGIQCPNCGKRGKVGAKGASRRPAASKAPVKPGPVVARPPPRSSRTAPPPKMEAKSPLDEITGKTTPSAAPPRTKKKTLACPACKKRFSVEDKPRPFKIECPHCGKSGMLR